jgi:hypothetical protein
MEGAVRSIPVGRAMGERVCQHLWRTDLTQREVDRFLGGLRLDDKVCGQ